MTTLHHASPNPAPAPQTVNTTHERDHPGIEETQPAASRHAGQHAEDRFARRLLIALLVAIPLLVVLWVGVIALAVSFTTAGYSAPLAMAAGVGVLAGVFWGTWYCFVTPRSDQELSDD